MMTALLQSPEQVASSRVWYTQRLAGLDMGKEEDRQTALAFLAGEGAFLLKAFGLIDLTQNQWTALFADMLALAGGRKDG
jgi:hypothetical protein